jgi:hypothetical protein
MSEPQRSADLPPDTPRVGRKRMAWGLGLSLLIGPGLASWYGYWLSVDSVQVSPPVDALVILAGYNRHELAAQWIREGRTREIWMISAPLTPMVKLGLARPAHEVNLERLVELGVSPKVVRQFAADLQPRDLPGTLREIEQGIQQHGTRQIVVTCPALEARFLRQVANAALAPEAAQKIQFVGLPSDRYVSTRWWLSRTGVKDAWNQTLQLLGNWWDGPTGGFEEVNWSPETWEPPPLEAAP